MTQKYTSANTSINKNRLPAIYGKLIPFLTDAGIHGANIFDYGCGRYTDHIKKAMENNGHVWHGYDKFNQSPEHNAEALDFANSNLMTVTVCSNVLNVIDSDDVVREVMADCLRIAGGGVVMFTIYDGDRSGIGRQTGFDSYQRNQKLREYIQYLPEGTTYKIKMGALVASYIA